MITVIRSVVHSSKRINDVLKSRAWMKFAGLSSDTKPTTSYKGVLIANGSILEEIDSGTAYQYDEENAQWRLGSAGSVSQQALADGVNAMATALEEIAYPEKRITSLTETPLAAGMVVESVGIPVYVDDVSDYSEYGLTETGWYVLARIKPKDGSVVSSEISIEGAAGYIATAGEDHIDVAVKFDVAAESQSVSIDWGTYAETIVFKATDLAIRNLDYRSTYYVYDLAPYAEWVYRRSADLTFSGTKYYVLENGEYVQAAVKARTPIPENTYYTHDYVLTEDTVFADGITYYTKSGTVFTPAEVVAGEEIPASTYYVDQWTLASGYFAGKAYYRVTGDTYEQIAVKAGEAASYATKLITYPDTETENFVGTEYWVPDDSDLGYARAAVKAGEEIPEGEYFTHVYTKLTAAGKFAADTRYYKLVDTEYVLQEVTVGASYAKNVYYVDTWTEAAGTFVGTAYYVEQDGIYEQAAVLANEPIPAGEYFTQLITWPQALEDTFADGVTYYINLGAEYTVADVAVGDPIPVYMEHELLRVEGMTRNVTYRFDETIDCPMEIVLPVIEDGESYGAWFDFQFRHDGSYSTTLTPLENVKIATNNTPNAAKGINLLHLHYSYIDGAKVWSALNTHTSFTED